MIRVNGADLEVLGETIERVIALLEIDPRGIAVARNGEIVRRIEWSSTVVHSGDQIEIVTAAAGG